MCTSKNSKVLCLSIALLLLIISGIAEARSGHRSRNNNHHFDRGHHNSNRHYRSFGHRVSLLPAGYIALTFAGLHYFYHAGAYYQRAGHEYAIVRPPLGVGISILPGGYRTIYHGGDRYYLTNGIFYRWDDYRGTYVVVDDPYPIAEATSIAASIPEQYVYPRQGQSSSQTSRDRYECYLWAVDQTGVEPAQVNNLDMLNNMENYQRANGACLEARGYSVK
jgi:Family of unknown function (DUF6515)